MLNLTLSVCVYGIMLGGFQYSLKILVFEKVRSKRFPWAWGFIELSEAPLLVFGMPIFRLFDYYFGSNGSVYLSATSVFTGGIFFIILSGVPD